MTNFSLVFPPKRLARLAIFFICLIILSQVYLSIYLSRYVKKVINKVDENLGKIYISEAAFNFISGLTLINVAVIDNSAPPRILFQAKRLTLGFNRLDIFFKELNFNKIKFNDACLYIDKGSKSLSNLSSIMQATYQEFLKNQVIPLKINLVNPAYSAKDSRIVFADLVASGAEGYWVLKLNAKAFTQANEVTSRGVLNLEYKLARDCAFANLFRDQVFSQDSNYELKLNFKGNDLIIEMFDLGLGYDHLTGQAIVKNFNSSSALINLIVNSSNLSVENLSSLVKDFDTRGTFSTSAIIRGPLDNLKFIATFNFLGCSFHYLSLPVLRNIVGRVYWTGEALKINDLFFITKDIPLKINVDLSRVKDQINLSAEIKIKQPEKDVDFLPRWVKFNFSGLALRNNLSGDSGFSLEARDDNLYSFKLAGFRLESSKGEKLLSAKNLIFSSRSVLKNDEKEKLLNFSDFAATLHFTDNGLGIKDMKTAGFNGKLSGSLNVLFLPSYAHSLYLRADNIDAAQIQDGLNLPYNLLGDISARLYSSSRASNFFEGVLLIKNGKLQNTAILLALSEYMKIDSLKAIDFDIMQLNFSFLKAKAYRYGLKSKGPEAIIKANVQIGNDNQLSSHFSAKFSQKMLKESVQFRKLLKITGEKSGFVDFPFVLSGTIHKPRLKWLRNDFKRSLERVIPEWYRKGMQRGVDSVVDDMSNENN